MEKRVIGEEISLVPRPFQWNIESAGVRAKGGGGEHEGGGEGSGLVNRFTFTHFVGM